METNNMMRFLFVFVLQLMLLMPTQAFKCQSCSYSYSKDNPTADTACINLPDVYTGSQVLDCKDYCVVQETYNKVLQKVVAYWRSCTDKPDTEYCIGDQLLTCVYTCQGDFCNSWIRGQLHELFPNSATGTLPKSNFYSFVLASGCVLVGWMASALC